jgi:predicted ribosome quality control (RQC) complex YloA/Tae2 family protein
MVSNYYILTAVMQEFGVKCTGSFLMSAYSHERDELCLEFDNGTTLAILARAGLPQVYFKEQKGALPKKNILKFFPDLVGQKLLGAETSKNDKFFTLLFADSQIIIRLYDNPNVLLKNNGDITSFKKEYPVKDGSQLRDIIQTSMLHAKLPMLGKVLEREFTFRYPDTQSEADLENNCKEYDALLREQKGAYLYFLNSGKLLLSPIELKHISDFRELRRFDSVNETATTTIFKRKQLEALVKQRTNLENLLLAFIVDQEKTISMAEKSLDDTVRADRYHAIADTLTAESYQIPKGANGWKANILGKEEIIVLDPLQSVFQIADKFYAKARYSRNAKKDLSRKLAGMKENLQFARIILEEIKAITSIKELAQKAKQLESSSLARLLKENKRGNGKTNEPSFREFVVSGGYRVFVGKNAQQNDRLTFGFARKEDLWLHARHVAGSHVIIRSDSRSDTLPKETIEAAAAIAAYFSDAKTQKFAPVAYTKRKYVRKPRGAAPGEVVLEREEVVIVPPKNPGGEPNE